MENEGQNFERAWETTLTNWGGKIRGSRNQEEGTAVETGAVLGTGVYCASVAI